MKTPVAIINQPYKVGWLNHRLFLEVHPALQEYRDTPYNEYEKVRQLILSATNDYHAVIFWNDVKKALKQHKGIPLQIGEEH